MGFATSIDTDKLIKSIQAIYYTDDAKVCAALATTPTLGQNTVIKVEPFSLSGFMEKFHNDPVYRAWAVKWLIAIGAVIGGLLIGLAILFAFMCLKPQAVRLANPAKNFYEDLKAKFDQ